MLGKDHITLSLFTASVIMMHVLDGNDVGLFLLVIIAVAIGSLAPDVDSPDAAIFHDKVKGLKGNSGKMINNFIGPLLPIFGFVVKYLIYLPSVKIIQFLIKKEKVSFQYKVSEAHRGIFHSFLGAIIVFITIFMYGSILMFIFPDILSIMIVGIFASAFFFGFSLHLLEDSCTVSGINFTFPMSKKCYLKEK